MDPLLELLVAAKNLRGFLTKVTKITGFQPLKIFGTSPLQGVYTNNNKKRY
jgi:hypothetical protein